MNAAQLATAMHAAVQGRSATREMGALRNECSVMGEFSAAKAEWAAAFVRAQSQLVNPPKTATANVQSKSGASYSYDYAELPDVIDSVRIVLAENGLAFAQSVISEDGSVGVTTIIYHRAGHSESFGPLYMPAGQTPQEYGSATTYARRYALCAALGIAADSDDDAQAASKTSRGGKGKGYGEGSASKPPRETTSPPATPTDGPTVSGEQAGGEDNSGGTPAEAAGGGKAISSPESSKPPAAAAWPVSRAECRHTVPLVEGTDGIRRCRDCGSPDSELVVA